MKKKRLLGIGFVGISFVLAVNNLTITGAVIGNSLSNFFGFIALVFFVVGSILILVSSEYADDKEKIKRVIGQYESGEISPVEAVREINVISPISFVKFKYGLEHSICGERYSYPISVKDGKKAEELAIVEYIVAVRNRPELWRKNELHLGKGVSTKHYPEKLNKLVEYIKRKYSLDLESKLG